MARLSRLALVGFLIFWGLDVGATSWAQARSPITKQIAKTYGLDSFGQIEAIRYTFNLELPVSPVLGFGSQRPAKSPTREKIRTASRLRLPMFNLSSTKNLPS